MNNVHRVLGVFIATLVVHGHISSATGQNLATTRAVQTQPTVSTSLDVRVSMDYRGAPAADVIRALASAAGISIELGTLNLRSITVTLTNVRLRTALDAVCDNAGCTWELQGTVMKVARADTPPSRLLPRIISIELFESPLADVLNAVAVAIDVDLAVEMELPQKPVSLRFRNAEPEAVLNFLCQVANCVWDLDPSRRLTIRRRP